VSREGVRTARLEPMAGEGKMSTLTALLRRPVRLSDPVNLALIVIVIYVAFLIGAAISGHWPVDQNGHPILIDYLSMWAAGRLALVGHAAAAYDWAAHKAIEVGAVGHDFDGYFSWFYPPTFFFATAPFAALPFVPALLAWIAAGLALFLLSIHAVLPRRRSVVLAAAAPVVLWNATAGQNGYLSAAIIAGALALIDRRPIVAGALIACLTFKPQFGLLVPVAFVAGGYWRAFLSAAVATVLLAAVSVAVFGADAWAGFVSSIDVAYKTVLVDTDVGAAKLQSMFGVLRVLGGGTGAAWAAQLTVAVPVGVFIAWLWRSPAPTHLKAAALAAGTALATPYVFIYDLVILVVPIAFLARSGLSTGEAIAAAAAALLLLSSPITSVPVGLAASLVVAGIVLARIARFSRAAKNAAQAPATVETSEAREATSSTTVA
jgi:arabinofuranan 3-O-arabinosyltransferase